MKTFTWQALLRIPASVSIALFLIVMGPGAGDRAMAQSLTVGQSRVRICGTVPLPGFPDQICGGINANSNKDACPLSDYCCNQSKPATCATTLSGLPAACVSAGNACQMPAPIHACEERRNDRDNRCIAHAGDSHNGYYCCADSNVNPGVPGYSLNVVNLTLFNGPMCTDPVNDFCVIHGATPTPTPEKPTPTPIPERPTPTPTTVVPTSTPTKAAPTATPTKAVPTATATPGGLACPNDPDKNPQRRLAVVNSSSEDLWVGGGGGALRALCVLPDGTSCIPPEGAFSSDGNCSCTPGVPTGGKLSCPGTAMVANGGMNCAASTCSPTNTECGPGAGCNASSTPANMCFFNLPEPTVFPDKVDPWRVPKGGEVDFCIPPAHIRNPNKPGQNMLSAVWWSGGLFARTGCKPDGTQCTKTDCSGGQQPPNSDCLTGTAGNKPFTIAEFTLQRTEKDFYDITIINGANLAEEMAPIPPFDVTPPISDPTFKNYWCKIPGSADSGVVGKAGCNWDLGKFIKDVPFSPTPAPGTDETTTLLQNTLPCTPNGPPTKNGCPGNLQCAGNPGTSNGTCWLQCKTDSDCPTPELRCEQGLPDGTKFCQCDSDSQCPSSRPFCGTQFVPFVGGRYQTYIRECGNFAAWWSADDFCGALNNEVGSIKCGAHLTNGDGANTNIASLLGCNSLGASNNSNSQSCYTQNNPGCCGCGTSPANPLNGDWPDDPWPDKPSAEGGCANNNKTWASDAQPWLVNLKKACPTAYAYPFDDFTSTFQCQGPSLAPNVLGYKITFRDLVKPTP